MKKLFISVPMRGRSEVNIKKSIEKMHKIAEVLFECELEVIQSYKANEDVEAKHPAVYCLGEAIKKMSQADCYIGVEVPEFFLYSGCAIENHVAKSYGIPMRTLRSEDVVSEGLKTDLYRILLDPQNNLSETLSEKS